jgi:hypothetical protein
VALWLIDIGLCITGARTWKEAREKTKHAMRLVRKNFFACIADNRIEAFVMSGVIADAESDEDLRRNEITQQASSDLGYVDHIEELEKEMSLSGKMIRGIKVNPVTRTIEEIMLENSLSGMYKATECDIVERHPAVNEATDFPNDMYVNEEAPDDAPIFRMRMKHRYGFGDGYCTVKGCAVIVGTDGENWESHHTNVDIVTDLVHFVLEPEK